jgi:2-polyprenyl-6-methoxyphenol hydroxylase-like FAD-dependent oxidoreductase
MIEGDQAIEIVKAQMKDVCEPFRSGIQWIPAGEDTKLFVTQLHYWIPVPWDNRRARVTLAGDAAHPMLPSEYSPVRYMNSPLRFLAHSSVSLSFVGRGQGLNHALDDISKFLAQFEKIKEEGLSLDEALKTYEAEVVERGAEAVQVSLDDAERITKIKQIQETRHAQQGLEA